MKKFVKNHKVLSIILGILLLAVVLLIVINAVNYFSWLRLFNASPMYNEKVLRKAVEVTLSVENGGSATTTRPEDIKVMLRCIRRAKNNRLHALPYLSMTLGPKVVFTFEDGSSAEYHYDTATYSLGSSQPFKEFFEIPFIAEQLNASSNEATAEPTETPDPDAPTEEEFIDAAWPTAERIAELYGLDLSKDTVSCSISRNNQAIYEGHLWIPDSREDGATLRLQINCPAGAREFTPVGMYFESTHSDGWWSSLEGYKFYGMVLTVTAEELSASGCTAEPGQPEFELALNLCWAEKLAEELKNAPDGDPMKCTEVVVSIDQGHVDDDDAVSLIMRPVDPDKLFAVMENYCTLLSGSSWLDYEYFGWYGAEFRTSFTRNEDGSWSSPISDYYGG